MHLLELIHAGGDDASRKTRKLLERVVNERDDVVLICTDATSEAGKKKTTEIDLTTIPAIIIDRQKIIKGVPHSTDQIRKTLDR